MAKLKVYKLILSYNGNLIHFIFLPLLQVTGEVYIQSQF